MNPITIAKLEVYGVMTLIVIASVFAAYFYAEHQGVMKERATWEAKEAIAKKADDDAREKAQAQETSRTNSFLAALQTLSKQQTQSKGVIEHEIQTNRIVYAGTCLPESGMRLYDALSASSAQLPGDLSGFVQDAGVSGTNGTAAVGRNGSITPPGASAGSSSVRSVPRTK
jgi:hypothetical protein